MASTQARPAFVTTEFWLTIFAVAAVIIRASSSHAKERGMRFGRNVEVRPLGGMPACCAMTVASLVISVLLTVLLNLAH